MHKTTIKFSPFLPQVLQTVKTENNQHLDAEERSSAHHDEGVNISNLTAEIESFVKIADTDKEKLRDSPEKSQSQPQHQPQPTALHIDEDRVQIRSPVPQETKTVVVRVTTTAQILRENSDKNVEKCQTHELNNNNNNNGIQTIATDIDTRQSPENNDYYPADGDGISADAKTRTASCEKLQNLVTEADVANNNVQRCKKSPVKILIRAPTDDDKENQVEEISLEIVENGDNCNRTTTPLSTEVDEILENACREANRIVSEIGSGVDRSSALQASSDANSNEAGESASRTSNSANLETKTIETKKVESEIIETSIVSTEKKPVEIKTTELVSADAIETDSTTSVAELKITESTDDLTKIPSPKSTPKTTIFEVRNIPLKGFSSSMVRKEIDLRKEQQDDEEQEVAIRNKKIKPELTTVPTPPQRRRSVKEIIESINKSQSLLKINQKPAPTPSKDENKYKIRNTFPMPVVERNNYESARCTVTTTKQIDASRASSSAATTTPNDIEIDVLSANERHMKEMIADMEIDRNGNDTEELAHIPLFVERFNALNNNNHGLFQKCLIKREQTPDNFLDTDNRSSVDWNPLPKPRRTKNSPH